MTWKDKVFGNGSGFEEDTLYLATYHDDEEIEDDRVRFSYAVKDGQGTKIIVNRSIRNSRYHLMGWLKAHTDFDETDADMAELKAANHLVLIGHYEGHPFIQKVFPLDKEMLGNE